MFYSSAICSELYDVYMVMMFVVSYVNYCPRVHGPPSFHWTATADPMGIDAMICEVSFLFLCCLSNNLL